ncbi:MAG: hypothetical protein ABEK17_03780 [Candidatus Aenigmatarchaeota archaeon]
MSKYNYIGAIATLKKQNGDQIQLRRIEELPYNKERLRSEITEEAKEEEGFIQRVHIRRMEEIPKSWFLEGN